MSRLIPGRGAYRDITECRRGHPYTEENTAIDAAGRRRCRVCTRERNKKWGKKNPGAVLGFRTRGAQRTFEWRARNPERCREIGYNHRLKTKYRMTRKQYDAIYAEQHGRCAICQKEGEKLNVDHNHATGTVRGLLCGNCNRGIGNMQDDPEILRAAAVYVEVRNG